MQIMTGLRKGILGFVGFVVVVALMLGTVTPVIAVKVSNVRDTPHNLSSSQVIGMFGSDAEEICVFCHTPHNASVAVPLWNHYSTTNTFTVYSSGTLEPGVYNSGGLPTDSISRLCLSCHEGTTALNSLTNFGTSGVQPTMPLGAESFEAFFGVPEGVYLSADLTAMHPVGFDYLDAVGDLEIHSLADAKTEGLKFFGATNSFLECSTCHDPHVDGDSYGGIYQEGNSTGDFEYKWFLRKSNTSSALCLACHNK